MKFRLFVLCAVSLGFLAGCGGNENKVTAPDKFLPPTKAAGVGTGGGGGDETAPTAEIK